MMLAGALGLAAGCVDNTIVTPENAPTVDALAGDLTSAGVQTLALGVLAQDRALVRSDLTYYILTAIYARDAYRIDPNEPRYVSETLGGYGVTSWKRPSGCEPKFDTSGSMPV